jgi:uncharacterized protein YaaQ
MCGRTGPLKLLITIIHERDHSRVSDSLLGTGYKFTKISSTGGFLRDGNATLLIGVEEEDVDTVIGLVRDSCKTREQYVSLPTPDAIPGGAFIPSPVKVTVGGAVIFIVDVERFERL